MLEEKVPRQSGYDQRDGCLLCNANAAIRLSTALEDRVTWYKSDEW